MKKHFVVFYSPGTFFAEDCSREIESWDVDAAVEMSRDITERYGATPYGFRFITRSRNDDDLDSSVTERSNMYYLGGEVFTVEQLKAQGDPDNDILIRNMECNNWPRVITNSNSWKWTQPLHEDDVILPYDKNLPHGNAVDGVDGGSAE